MKEKIKLEIKNSINIKEKILNDDNLIELIDLIFEKCYYSLKNNGKIIFCGNGGSFADSQHLAAEFVSRLRFDRNPLPSLALGTNSSNLSAIGNDYGYENIFSRELSVLGNKNDIFVPISTSGNSPNIIKAIKAGKKIGMTVFGLTGKNGGLMNGLCDYTIIIPSDSTEKIQESHIMIGHILCYLIESKYFNKI
ncbi:MAG: phosphoheptose isomerase [Gammaproteobacteria bacterium]|nr:phosphoheptose isomerase [Gammaproteobacteria bacterium]